jgi:hypothetical protein
MQARSRKIMKMQMFATVDMEKPHTGNIRSLNLVVVKHMTVRVTELSL